MNIIAKVSIPIASVIICCLTSCSFKSDSEQSFSSDKNDTSKIIITEKSELDNATPPSQCSTPFDSITDFVSLYETFEAVRHLKVPTI